MHLWNPMQPEPATPWERRIDELMAEQTRIHDPGERLRLFHQVLQTLADEAPFVPLVNRNVLFAHDQRLTNIKVANVFPYALSDLWSVYWKSEG